MPQAAWKYSDLGLPVAQLQTRLANTPGTNSVFVESRLLKQYCRHTETISVGAPRPNSDQCPPGRGHKAPVTCLEAVWKLLPAGDATPAIAGTTATLIRNVADRVISHRIVEAYFVPDGGAPECNKIMSPGAFRMSIGEPPRKARVKSAPAPAGLTNPSASGDIHRQH